jgi:protein required for attachment to host cells
MKTWILAADSTGARLFEATARDGELVLRASFESPQSRLHGSDFTSERVGRVQESANTARHGIEPRADPHEKVVQQFAHELARMLDRGRVEHAYEHLVLLAPPRFLGQLRGALDEKVARLVVKSLDKDATGADIGEVEAILRT